MIVIGARTGKTVLVTGANGYIGNAVAKAFSRAGWTTYGLVRSETSVSDLARHEIHPVLGSPEDLSLLEGIDVDAFDVIVSNTEDHRNPTGHLEKVRTMLDEIARRALAAGTRPLVMFTSGCKDYGAMSLVDGDAGLAPHTETPPMNVPAVLEPRMQFGLDLLDAEADFDVTVLRPTIVYGHSSSHYGELFRLAAEAEETFELTADPAAIMHSLHVDDCADAYVVLAEHERTEVAGEAFNLSNTRYETAQEVGEAIARSYDLTVKFTPPAPGSDLTPADSLANFSQWVGSDKVRELTGWNETKPSFVDGFAQYRIAAEAFHTA